MNLREIMKPIQTRLYLFLNASFGQKVLYHLNLVLFAVNSTFFYSISLNFLMIFFCTTPFSLHFTPPKKFFAPSKIFSFHYLKNFPPPNFLLLSLTSIFWVLQKVGVLTPKIPPALAPLPLNLQPFNLGLHPSTAPPPPQTQPPPLNTKLYPLNLHLNPLNLKLHPLNLHLLTSNYTPLTSTSSSSTP